MKMWECGDREKKTSEPNMKRNKASMVYSRKEDSGHHCDLLNAALKFFELIYSMICMTKHRRA